MRQHRILLPLFHPYSVCVAGASGLRRICVSATRSVLKNIVVADVYYGHTSVVTSCDHSVLFEPVQKSTHLCFGPLPCLCQEPGGCRELATLRVDHAVLDTLSPRFPGSVGNHPDPSLALADGRVLEFRVIPKFSGDVHGAAHVQPSAFARLWMIQATKVAGATSGTKVSHPTCREIRLFKVVL